MIFDGINNQSLRPVLEFICLQIFFAGILPLEATDISTDKIITLKMLWKICTTLCIIFSFEITTA
jgi:hypothetical protein